MTWHDAHISHDCTKLSAVFSKMNPTKLLQLALFLVAPLANVVAFEETEFVVDVSPSMIRGGNVGMEEYSHHGRELSFAGSWSWSNLLFHLGVCHAHHDCPSRPHPGPCGCPDCSKPHPPHFQRDYCENITSSSIEGDETSEEDSERTTGEEGTNGTTQVGSSRSWWMIAAAAAAAACAVVVAAAMRKRNTGEDRELSAEAAEGSDYKLMGGVSAALAGVMAKMGMRPSGEEASTGGNSGIVSKRLNLLQNGADVASVAAPAPKPAFIEIQNDLDYSHDMIECDESVEIEGPYRPSSQYAL